MNKRIISLLLGITIFISALAVPAYAVESRTSDYISNYTVSLSQGSNSGEIKLTYSVTSAVANPVRVGVWKIVVHTASGSIYKTIYGTTANGLLHSSVKTASGTYTIACEPNTSYYCVVTVYATDANGSDSIAVTTNTAKSHA